MRNSPLVRSSIAGLAGFFGYGGWAVFANIGHGMSIAVRSGLIQGTYSLILTFAMTLVTEWLFRRLVGFPFGATLTVVLISSVLFTTAFSIHYLVGTPEILMTILPGFFIGLVYTSAYVVGLGKGTKAVGQGQ